jgi:SNF2 family DNA or RNA helicase
MFANIDLTGLTLTVARRVLLLEPFLKAGEEQQALNRCHRIGQTRPVLCTTLYCSGTIEERMLVRVLMKTTWALFFFDMTCS